MPEIVPAFPLLDAPRSAANAELGRVVMDFLGYVEPHISELDTWCSMPLRLVYDQAGGHHLECGPYGLSHTDIEILRHAIAAYDQATGEVK